jgi:hypothetical protein
MKQQKGDFQKDRTKVGKKVVRKNQSKIKLKSKQIYVPTQLNVTSTSLKDKIQKCLKGINHNNVDQQIFALKEIVSVLTHQYKSDDKVEVSFSQILSSMLELLSHEDERVRSTLASVFEELFGNFDPLAFAASLPILLSYLSSGISHANKV